jgi:hypothetical protein
MITSITRSVSSARTLLMAGAAAVLSVAALGFSSAAHARSDINFSVGVSTPGVVIGVSNAYPVYTSPVYGYHQQPVYVQPAPVYVQPRPVYRPRPVYVQAPVYVAPPPVYYRGGRHHHHHHRHHGHGHRGHGHRH